jgi:hypothetical protein
MPKYQPCKLKIQPIQAENITNLISEKENIFNKKFKNSSKLPTILCKIRFFDFNH